MNISFSGPQNWVELQVAAWLFTPNALQNALTVTAYDIFGLPLFAQSVSLSYLTGSPDQLQWGTVLFDAGIQNCVISRIEICTKKAFVQYFYVDNVRWGNDQAKPDVFMDNPLERDCICDGDLIVDGSVCDDGCGDVEVELLIRPIVTGTPPPYNSLAIDTPVPCTSIPGLFAVTLPASAYPEGEYLLKMVATDACGRSNTVDRVILIDRLPPQVTIGCPVNGKVYCKRLDIVGSATDLCMDHYEVYFGPASGPAPLIASGTANVGPVIASIDTAAMVAGAPVYPDGPYRLFVRATDKCGRSTLVGRQIIVDNTPPIAYITSPMPCGIVCQDDMTAVEGVIYDEHLAGWTLDYKMGTIPGLPPGTTPPWQTIASGTGQVGFPGPVWDPIPFTGRIATWNQCGLPNCCYILRLTAWDTAENCPYPPGSPVNHNVTVHEFCANLGLLGDIDGDGVIGPAELNYVLSYLGLQCPPCP